MSTLIYRIVPRGEPAENWDDRCDEALENDETLDLDAPCDLVALEGGMKDGEPYEKELQRKQFGNGHGASAYLLSLVKRKDDKPKE